MSADEPFATYVALGDSMSIDLYPALDAGEIDVAVTLERVVSAGAVAPIGAASLLYRNDDQRYPEEQGADLVSWYPGIALQNLAQDGATIGDVFGEQLPQLAESDERTLITITIGGNDLFLLQQECGGWKVCIAGSVLRGARLQLCVDQVHFLGGCQVGPA